MMPIRTSLMVLWTALLLGGQPTVNILQRTFRIETKHGHGTAFSIDVDGREYWVTARHLLTGAKGKPYGKLSEKTVEIKFLNPGGNGLEWFPVKFTVLQPEADVDVAVLVPSSLVLARVKHASPPASTDDMVLGQPCLFLGCGLDGGWRMNTKDGKYWLPYIKHCTVSGMDMDSKMWVLDGINNPGFSGGHVILGTGGNLKFAAVISGYYLETAEVIRGGPTERSSNIAKDTVNVNSGFIIAYDIAHVVDLIKKNPTGPLRIPATK